MLSSVWDQIITFIERREPGYAQAVRGADDARVQAVAAAYGIELPAAYAGFLRAMGEAAAGFRVFPDHHFVVDAVLALAEEAGGWDYSYSPADYLPVGFEYDDKDEIEGDICLDLRHDDRADPPVVLIDPTEEDEHPSTLELGTSFTAYVQARAFSQYERLRRGFTLRLSAPDADPEDPKPWTAMAKILERFGLAAQLPGAPGLWIGGGETVSVAMRRPAGLIVADLVGDAEAELTRLSETAQDNLDLPWTTRWTRRDHVAQ